ncbi:MAG: PAS domain S-box protein [Gammaproteobacteria bacterium]|nr:MAG: PAS domain S-box protein [Gammaproteobacteria bacterium]
MIRVSSTPLIACAQAAAAFAMLVGGLVLIGGWALDIAALRSVLPGLATMKANTALGLAGAGTALWLLREGAGGWRRRAGLACAGIAVLIGVLTLAQYAFGWNLGIDELLFADPESLAAGTPPGRPAPNTALAILLLGLAPLFLDYETRRGRRPAEGLTLAAGLIAFLGLLGYAYGVRSLYGVALYSSMAVHTAFVALLLALGVLFARPRRGLMAVVTGDSAGGYMARRLLPTALIVPPLLGGIRLIGERAGLYGLEFGLALFAASNVVVFTALVWWNAHLLARLDRQRHGVLEELRQANESLEQRVAERTAALQGEVVERRKIEQRFRGLFESAPDAIVVSEPGGRIVLANSQAEQLFGYTREELVGQTIELLVPERFHAAHLTHRAGYVAEPRTRMMGAGMELFAQRKDGSEFPVGISLSPIQTEQGTLIFSDIRDVSWRKKTERELRASEARFRAVSETANDAVITADREGNIVYFNRAAERIFGYSVDQAVGQSLTLLMPERFRASHGEGLKRFLSTGEAHVVGKTVELAGRRREGAEFPLELSLASWKVGEETYFTGLVRDITRRRQAEQDIRQLNDSLRERAAELEVVNKELEAFSYSVSHDLRAPLRAIDGFSRILLAEHAGALDATARDRLARVRRAAQHMAALIDDLLKLSRVTRAELSLEEVDLGALAQAVAEGLRGQDPARTVRFDIARGLAARADPRLLRVALENLLGNAWKFTGRRAEAHIEFGATERDGQAAYFVRDDGAGFDMAYADKLFGAFQRLHDAAEFPGTGIGLATVQRIVHKHGGRVWAEAAVDRGATFYFTLAQEGVYG